jgi:hypothetical protein
MFFGELFKLTLHRIKEQGRMWTPGWSKQMSTNSYDMKRLLHVVPVNDVLEYDTDNSRGIISIGRHNFTLPVLEREPEIILSSRSFFPSAKVDSPEVADSQFSTC